MGELFHFNREKMEINGTNVGNKLEEEANNKETPHPQAKTWKHQSESYQNVPS